MRDRVDEVLRDLGIERLAHFTPAKNLFHIIQDGEIRSSKELADSAPEYFAPTDHERFDGRPDMTCVSFTFPNGYYLAQARHRPQFNRFPDWVCLMLDAQILTRPGVLFSPHNAARSSGAHAHPGGDALRRCFAGAVGSWRRGPAHHPSAATDLQAEALIPGPIPAVSILSVVVPSAEAAGEEYARLDVGGLAPARLNWVVAPTIFDRDALSSAVRFGHEIGETPWSPTVRSV